MIEITEKELNERKDYYEDKVESSGQEKKQQN